MTRSEQAAFKRIDKRRNDLFVALCIIHTWIVAGFDTPKELLYKISSLATKQIEAEKAAWKKEIESK